MDPSPAPDRSGGNDDGEGDVIVWSGNIQYLINISTIGALCCVFIFFFLKLRSDHRQIPGPSALLSKLLAVWHATGREIARHCGADAAQFLIIEGGSCAVLIVIAVIALVVLLPLNLYMGNAVISDQFSRTIISHIDKGSPLLWIHFISVLVIVILAHFGISSIQGRLKVTRFRDGFGNPSDPTSSLTAIFTLMVQGIPKNLGFNPSPLKTYFQNKYPGRIFRVIVPMDLCALNDLIAELVHVRDEISWLVARIDSSFLPNEQPEQDQNQNRTHFYQKLLAQVIDVWRKLKTMWVEVERKLGFTDEIRLSRLQQLRGKLEAGVSSFKQGHVPGAGVAFVVFNDVDTANKALQDFKREKMKRMGTFFSVTELQMGRNQWKVGRAPLATDIYWNHLGLTKVSLKLRRVCVNTCLVLLLLFFSSPLSVISAVKSAGRIISIEAMDNAQSWVTWVQSSSWIGTLIFQFLPNVIVFVSMYIVVPSALSYLSKFERHITVSGEQRAALLKMVCFFLVNLIILRALVESSLEGLILRMGKCYLDGEECKRFEQYLNWSFLSKSCLSSLAFLIASTFLGISFDLLAPVPWIKKKIQKFRKNDMLHLVPEQTENTAFGEEGMMDDIRSPLLQEEPTSENGFSHYQDMSVYPINGASPLPKQTFDFAQYYAFNLTVFALTMIYSSFAPLVVPVGAIYFGYRYVVDKYNFLFVYRVRGYPSGNDGRLMDTVLFIMRFSVDLFLLSMILFFSVQGDSTKLQAIFTLGLLIMYKLLPTHDDNSQPTVFEGMQGISNLVDDPIDYELLSQPRFDLYM